MTTNLNRSTGRDSTLQTSPRDANNWQTKTQAGPRGQLQHAPKFKKGKKGQNLQEMAYIYADVGARHQRQQAVATQIRLQYMEGRPKQ